MDKWPDDTMRFTVPWRQKELEVNAFDCEDTEMDSDFQVECDREARVPVLDVFTYSRSRRILSHCRVRPGSMYRVGAGCILWIDFQDRNTCRVLFGESVTGVIVTNRLAMPVSEIKKTAARVDQEDIEPVFVYQMSGGDFANLASEDGGVFVRLRNRIDG